MAILAADIGGTKIAAGVVDIDGVDAAVHARRECPSDSSLGANHVFDTMLALLRQTQADYGQPIASIGISTGGDVDANAGRINYATPMIPGYTGFDARAAVEREFGPGLRVKVEKDGNCAALAETVLGSARGFRHALTVIVGTGIGAGFVSDGAILHGAHGGALNPGQIRLDEEHTYEDVASCGALARQYNLPIQRVATLAHESAQLLEPVANAGRRLGDLLAVCAAILDPDVIVVAGSVLLFGPRLLDLVSATYQRQARAPLRHVPIVPSTLGGDSALIGAGLL